MYHGVQRALIGLQKDYLRHGKCLGFAIEKTLLPYGASWGPSEAPFGLWAPRKILGCHPLSKAVCPSVGWLAYLEQRMPCIRPC